MPELSSWLSKSFERFTLATLTVSSVEVLTSRLRLVRLEGEALQRRTWEPGQEVKIRVGERDYRHYTPISYRQEQGEMEIIFYLNQRGPGSRWVEQLRVGQPVPLAGPANGAPFIPLRLPALFLGDETALGLGLALQASQPQAGAFQSVIEVSSSEHSDIMTLFPQLTIIPRLEGQPGSAHIRWLEQAPIALDQRTCYLVGHAQSIQAIRQVLMQRYHLERQGIKTKPYWADGKRGL
ncbi:siderophore-interacting protein [Thermogemmatispora carboxidivorans]|uniref:siderophore-interacting protein n=1 Tax=Thermogemmatispora carboxidivorans TaxID=1382306 RepID=UPI00069A6435|nr:siderophore-interacting protein [Thermogemmatispora carboxidivorans]